MSSSFQNGRGRGARDLNPRKRGRRDPALPGAHALRAVRARRSVGNICRANVFPQWSPHKTSPRGGSRGPRSSPVSGGVLVFGKSCAVGLSALVLKVMEILKVTEAPLPGPVCAPARRSPLAEFPRASAELPRASEESSARLRGAWRCCPPLVAGQPRVGLRADPCSGAWRRLLP